MEEKTPDALDISVIIVSWNVKTYLYDCLSSVYKNTGAAFEVLVADNGSSDGSVDMVREKFPATRLIANGENLGFAKANNIAIKQSSGRYILFLNPDTLIAPGTLRKMRDFMDLHEDAGGLGCKLLYPDGTLQMSCRHFPSAFTDLMENLYLDWLYPKSRFFNYYRMGSWAHDKAEEVDVVYGACLIVRRKVVNIVGPFDERFFMYYDEVDLCYRIKKAGFRIYFDPSIQITHHCNKSSDQALSAVSRWKCRSKYLFFRKHYGLPGVLALRVNLSLQAFIVWGPVSLFKILFRRPRGLDSIKGSIALAWEEYKDGVYDENTPPPSTKVCHLLDTLNVGGIERSVIEIAKGLKGYEHHVWCLGSYGALAGELADAGIEVRAFGFDGKMRIRELIALAGAMRKERFGIVDGHGLYPSIWSRIAAFMAGVHVRIAHAQSLYNTVPGRDAWKLRMLSPVTSKVIAVSEAVKESLIDCIGIDPSKIEVIYNACCDMRTVVRSSRESLRQALGVGGRTCAVGYVGRLVEDKGIAYLIEAVRLCRSRNLDVKCVIVGDGPGRANLEKIVEGRGLRESVVFLGLRHDIADLLSAMDILVQLSVIREGLPLTLAEGSSMGLPLIATSIGGNVEIVRDEENGFIVPPRDAKAIAEKIERLASDASLARSMGDRSRKIWEDKFTVPLMLSKLGDLYRRCREGKA